MTAVLIAFLYERLNEDEQTANQWHHIECDIHVAGLADLAMAAAVPGAICDCAGPARTLAEIDAKRRLLDYIADLESKALDGNWWNIDRDLPLQLLAIAYRDHPDYQEKWTP